MPPVTILSPYSGRPVKVREHDLGRALRDEEGRVFYVVEDPEHGRYAARTRKGSPKDLHRYREIEANVATLEGDLTITDQPAPQAHDATGSKRRNPVGMLFLLLVVAAVVVAGYVYLNHPEWLGLGTPANELDAASPEGSDADASSSLPALRTVPALAAAAPASRVIEPDAQPPTPPAPVPVAQPEPAPPAPNIADADPKPVIVPTQTWKPRPKPQPQPVTFITTQPQRTNYDDFRHTATGLRYKITHPTDGVSAKAGHYVSVRYTAQTLEGESLIDDAQQSFILMSGEAIRAFDEGLAGIREGEQLRLLVPRGHSESGTLPGIKRVPDQPFLMDVQLVSVKPGVTHIVEKPGDVNHRPAMPGDEIAFHYIARVEGRDEIIDTTIHRGKPMRITLGRSEVIAGLDLGLTGMRPGESRQLTIPPYLAYGRYSVTGGLIPANAVLSFRVTLVEIAEDDE